MSTGVSHSHTRTSLAIYEVNHAGGPCMSSAKSLQLVSYTLQSVHDDTLQLYVKWHSPWLPIATLVANGTELGLGRGRDSMSRLLTRHLPRDDASRCLTDQG